MILRVLSLWQPWASLCVVPDPTYLPPRPSKQWETRHWTPRLAPPFDVAIHATKHIEKDECGEWPFLDAKVRCGIGQYPLGVIVGVATVAEFARTESLVKRWSVYEDGAAESFAEEIAFGNYEPGRWGWRLANARSLAHPIPFRGRQTALYPLDEATLDLVAIGLSGIDPNG